MLLFSIMSCQHLKGSITRDMTAFMAWFAAKHSNLVKEGHSIVPVAIEISKGLSKREYYIGYSKALSNVVPIGPGGTMIRNIIATASAVLLCSMASASAQTTLSEAEYDRCYTLQDRFNEARAHQDADAMAAVFAQDAIRVTPDGVFQGRDAIRRNLESLVTTGLRDFTSERTVSRHEGNLLFDAGTWHAKLGDVPLHGYYSALLSCVGHQEILEETTNVAAPSRR